MTTLKALARSLCLQAHDIIDEPGSFCCMALVCSCSTLRSVPGKRCNDALGASTSYHLTASSPTAIKVAICGNAHNMRSRRTMRGHYQSVVEHATSAPSVELPLILVYPKRCIVPNPSIGDLQRATQLACSRTSLSTQPAVAAVDNQIGDHNM